MDAALAPIRGTQAIAQGIAQVGQVAGEFAQRLQHAENIKQIALGEMAMGNASIRLQEFMQTNPDPDLWEEEAQRLADEAHNEISSIPKLSHAAKVDLRNKHNLWKERFQLETHSRANVQRVRDVDTVLKQQLADAIQMGNDSEAKRIMDTRLEAGTINPAQHEAELMMIRNKVTEARVRNDILGDPAGTIARLQAKEDGQYQYYTELDEPRRLHLLSRARTEHGAIRQQTLNSLRDRQNQGEFISDEELQMMVDDQRLLATQAEWIRQGNRRIAPTEEVIADYLADLQAIRNFDPTDPEAEINRANLLALTVAKPYPPVMQQELQRTWRQYARGDGSEGGSPNRMPKDVLNMIDSMVQANLFGQARMFGSSAERAQQVAKVFDLRNDAVRRTEAWFAENPQANNQDLMARFHYYASEVMDEARMEGMSLTGPVLPEATEQRSFSGRMRQTYDWTTRWFRRNPDQEQ